VAGRGVGVNVGGRVGPAVGDEAGAGVDVATGVGDVPLPTVAVVATPEG
jgi:hypothetical protein